MFAWAAIWPLHGWASPLTWDKTEHVLTVEPGERDVRTAFAFHNATDRVVTITDVETTCGCTTAGLDKKTYEPGETGIIQAAFAIGDLTGMQEKKIFVRTDVAATEPQTLTLRVHIRASVAFARPWVTWRVGEASDERVLEATSAAPRTIERLELVTRDPAFDVKILPRESGDRFEIRIRPRSTTERRSGLLEFRAQTVSGDARTYAVFAYVR